MAYFIGQYNRSPWETDTENHFMEPFKIATASENSFQVFRVNSGSDLGVTGNDQNPFEDETVECDANFSQNKTYYFHGQIKRLKETQVFSVKLVTANGSELDDSVEQYIKTIKIAGDTSQEHFEWVDVEFLFTPIVSFNSIMFSLTRTVSDYRNRRRFPCVIFQELAEVKNLLGSDGVIQPSQLIKLGVQSRPGLLMSINNDEIKMSKTGIYEVKNGQVLVDFFAVVARGQESDTTQTTLSDGNNVYYQNNESKTIFDWKKKVSDYINRYEFDDEYDEDERLEEEDVQNMRDPLISDSDGLYPTSACFFEYGGKNNKLSYHRTYSPDAFTVDYMYSDGQRDA